MAKNTQQNWGTQAILEGSVRDRGGTLMMELNNPPDTRAGLPLRIVLKKETGEVIFNGHPFGGTEALISVLSRKLYLMKQRARPRRATSNGRHEGWVPGTEYARTFIQGGDRAILGVAFERVGLGVDHERYIPNEENRPQTARHLDYELFVYFIDPTRPLGAPAIDDVIAEVLEAEGLEGMANGRHVAPVSPTMS